MRVERPREALYLRGAGECFGALAQGPLPDTNIHALPVGHTFDGYRVLRLLGAGGFGITYLAEETSPRAPPTASPCGR